MHREQVGDCMGKTLHLLWPLTAFRAILQPDGAGDLAVHDDWQ